MIISNNKLARIAGILYLLNILTGIFSLAYVPAQIDMHGDAATVLHNIMASESLFRLGIFTGLLCFTIWLLLPLVLYKLLSQINKSAAVIMVAFALIFIPIDFMAINNKFNILSLLNNDSYRNAFTIEQVYAHVMLLMEQYNNGIAISEIFWGLWLIPFGYLVFKSNFLPKVLGIVLMLGSISYLADFLTQILFPHVTVPDVFSWISALGEFGICLWLLIFGAKESHAAMSDKQIAEPQTNQ